MNALCLARAEAVEEGAVGGGHVELLQLGHSVIPLSRGASLSICVR